MRARFFGVGFSLGWIAFQCAASAWLIWKHVPNRADGFLIWIGVPITGLISYTYGRLDQINSDLRKEIEWLESVRAVAKAKYLFHFTDKEN